MARVFGRRRYRFGVVLLVLAVGLAAGAVLLWWWPFAAELPQPGWAGTEQAGWVAGIVSAALSVISTVAAIKALRAISPSHIRLGMTGGLVQVGRVPLQAAWFQDRHIRNDLARAAKLGRTAVLTQVLSGMGGVGKTQLTAQFARQLTAAGELDVLAWVTASDRDAIIASYAEAARALGLADADTGLQAAAERLLAWLEHTDQRWLIVLDNLDTPAAASGWWPPSNRHGRTIVTTRRRDAVLHTDARTLITVDLFTAAEAVDYLTRAIGKPDLRTEVELLAADLGYLPLAVAQAAAFIRDRGLDCATYRQRLTDRKTRLAVVLPSNDALPDDHRTTVAATWALSIDAANTAAPRGLATPVLNIAALLDPNTIPAAVFTTAVVREYLNAANGHVDADEATVIDVLHNLHRLHLITHDTNTSTVRVHALVQRATRELLTDENLTTAAHTAADALIELWPDIERDPAVGQTLRSNTEALYRNTDDILLTPHVHPVVSHSRRSLGTTGLSTSAAAEFQALFDDCLRVLGPDHPDTLTTRYSLAHCRGDAGDAAGAVTALQALLSDRIRVLGPDHPDTLTTRATLNHFRGQAGDPAGAVTALQALLSDRIRVLGPDHSQTLITRNLIAYCRGQAGDPAGATTAFQSLLDDYLRVLGPDHLHTLAARHHLAYLRGQAGDPAGAATAFQALLDDRIRVVGPEHPDALVTRDLVAVWRGKAGDPAGAVTALQTLRDDYIRIFGPDHPDTWTTRHDLADWRGQAGDLRGATTAFEQLLIDQVRVLGPEHPDTLTTRNNLVHWRKQAGLYDGGLHRSVPGVDGATGSDDLVTKVGRASVAAGVAGARADGGNVMVPFEPLNHDSANHISAAAEPDPESPTPTNGCDDRARKTADRKDP